MALHLVGRKEEAEVSLKKAIALKANHIYPRAFLTALYVDLGQLDRAKQAAAEVIRLNPEFSAKRFMKSHTLHNEARDTRFIELMLSGGLPE